jgi:hypothetical protein
MEKLDAHIPQFRICSGTKKILTEMADEDVRGLTEFCRKVLVEKTKEYLKKKETKVSDAI